MKDYKDTFISLEATLDKAEALSISYSGNRAPTSSHYYSSLIFTKLCVSGITILNNCPKPSQIGRNAHWDFASVAALTRGLIESYLTFFYLCIEKCTVEEWNARWRLMNLHDHMSRYKMFLAANELDEAEKFEMHTEKVRADLERASFFQSLSKKKQEHFLKGNTAFFLTKDEIVKSFNGDLHEFRFSYRFLSNHTHTFPMGFYRMAESNRGCGVETATEMRYKCMCMSWANQYLERAAIDFANKWNLN